MEILPKANAYTALLEIQEIKTIIPGDKNNNSSVKLKNENIGDREFYDNDDNNGSNSNGGENNGDDENKKRFIIEDDIIKIVDDKKIKIIENKIIEILVYNACSKGSNMVGNILKRGEGISFDVFDSLESIALRKSDNDKKSYLRDNSPVTVLYGKAEYSGTIVKFRGHEMYDVRYTIDKKIEAGVSVSRLIPVNVAFRMRPFGPIDLPVLCVPLRHRSKAVGVLCVDSMAR